MDLEPVPGLHLTLVLPEGAKEVPSPSLDLSSVPGAELVLARSFAAAGTHGPVSLHVGCARAPSWLWAQGIEAPVLAGASALVKKNLALSTLEPSDITRSDDVFEQSFVGQSAERVVHGRHLLGLADNKVVLCSILCSETTGDDVCAPKQRIEFQGFEALPAPGIAGRALSLALSHPPAALSLLAASFVGATALLLARRPRPRH